MRMRLCSIQCITIFALCFAWISYTVKAADKSPKEAEILINSFVEDLVLCEVHNLESDDFPSEGEANATGEQIYNGIVLPLEWPPRYIDTENVSPMIVPYLEHPPALIPIDVGRQLFVDDFLIEATNMQRIFHKPVKYPGNPVLWPETPVELGLVEPGGRREYDMEKYHARESKGAEDAYIEGIIDSLGHAKPYGHGNAGAAPKSGGVWWDPADQLFKIWYETSWFGPIAMAISHDGLHWERPHFDIRPGTNIVSPHDVTPDSWTVIPNYDTTDPEQRWTMFVQSPGYPQPGLAFTSPDGIRWINRTPTGVAGDRTTHFYNPFRKKWVYSIRVGFHSPVDRGRARQYYETDDFLKGAQWTEEDKVPWLMTDQDDPTDYLTREKPQLYNFDAVAYESLMLGMFQLHHGPTNLDCVKAGLPKITELQFAYSRDGFHWHRPDRNIHIPAERSDVWDRGYIQSVGGIAAIVGDRLYIYYIGYQGNTSKAGTSNGLYDRSATGVAMLRRDGFASMDTDGNTGRLTTRPLVFNGKQLFVNVDAPNGILRAEVLDMDGNPIEPFTLTNSIPYTGNSTIAQIGWNGVEDISVLAGKPVRLHFELTRGSFYSFWVSRDETGRSDGYVAGGGPGYTGPTDTVGRAALKLTN